MCVHFPLSRDRGEGLVHLPSGLHSSISDQTHGFHIELTTHVFILQVLRETIYDLELVLNNKNNQTQQ